MTEPWQPVRGVQIVAGTPPGGGLDRIARATAGMLSGRSAGL
jgi:tripartite-type tricarboxylate transporter receptor subunit TctC